MKKAKSRLKKRSFSPGKTFKDRKKSFFKSWLMNYIEHLPTLLLSLPFYAGLYWLLTNFYPTQLENFLVPNTYLPLQLLLLGGNFFFFSYLLLHARRGLLLSLGTAWIVFLKLQLIENWVTVGVVGVGVLIVLEILLSLSKKWLR